MQAAGHNNSWYRQHRARPRTKREDGAPTVSKWETKPGSLGHPPQFADNNGFFAANFPDQPLTIGGQYSIQPGITMMSNDALSNPVTFGMLPVANLVVNVTSESANGWTFTTVPSQHFFDGTVSFSSTDAGSGNITFSVGVNANWVSPFTHYTIGPVIMAGENSTWNNMVSNVQAYCQAPVGS